MLKSYEDELYSKLKSKFPKKYLPRISTPTFNLQTSARKSIDSSKIPSLSSMPSYSSITSNSTITQKTNSDTTLPTLETTTDETEEMKKQRVGRQVQEAKRILDYINNIKPDSLNQINEDEEDNNSSTTSNYMLGANRRMSSIDIDSIELHKMRLDKNYGELAIKKYERWQNNWSKMLKEMF